MPSIYIAAVCALLASISFAFPQQPHQTDPDCRPVATKHSSPRPYQGCHENATPCCNPLTGNCEAPIVYGYTDDRIHLADCAEQVGGGVGSECGPYFGRAKCLEGSCVDGYCVDPPENTRRPLSPKARIALIATGSAVGGVFVLFILCCCLRDNIDEREPYRAHIARERSNDLDVRYIPKTEETGHITVNLRQCRCCRRKRAVEQFPSRRVTACCTHDPNICLDCLTAFIDNMIAANSNGLSKEFQCPEDHCGLQLTPEDVRAFASTTGFRSYVETSGLETRECPICVEDGFIPSEFAKRPVTGSCTSTCTENPPCLECVSNVIKAALDSNNFGRINCPSCPAQLAFKDIREFAEKVDFIRYDTYHTRKALESNPNFRWCLNSTGCPSGQIHEREDPLMICFACKFVMCYTHERPWHVGLTCDEYNEQAQKQQMEIMDSEKAIENTFRQCPACNVPIEKAHGTCNHMRCQNNNCDYQFCYRCLVKWTGYASATTHKRGCRGAYHEGNH